MLSWVIAKIWRILFFHIWQMEWIISISSASLPFCSIRTKIQFFEHMQDATGVGRVIPSTASAVFTHSMVKFMSNFAPLSYYKFEYFIFFFRFRFIIFVSSRFRYDFLLRFRDDLIVKFCCIRIHWSHYEFKKMLNV